MATTGHDSILRWGNDYLFAPCQSGIVNRDRVVSGFGCDARDLTCNLLDEVEPGPGVVNIAVRQNLRDDHTTTIDPEMELLPAAFSLSSIVSRSPTALLQ